MASPVLARSLIRASRLVAPDVVRIHEFLNYYSFDYEPPSARGRLKVSAQFLVNEQIPDGYERGYDLQIGVRAPNQTNAERRPLNMALSVDVSGSMAGDSSIPAEQRPIALARECCFALARVLRAGDTISIVSWDTAQNVVLDAWAVSGAEDSQVMSGCDSLHVVTDGTTDLNAGLRTAYTLVEKNYDPSRINRVVLISDGRANAGVTEANYIAGKAASEEGKSIYLMGVGVGSAQTYFDTLMNVVTDAGKGAYVFVDSAQEAQAAFGARFLANVELAAKEVEVVLGLPPSFEMIAFHGEESSTNPDEVEPQHLGPNDAMVFHQVVASCDATVLADDDEVTVTANYRDPLTNESKSDQVSYTLGQLGDLDTTLVQKGNAVVAYAKTLARVYDMAPGEAVVLIDETRATVEAASGLLGGDSDLDEIDGLLLDYRALFE